MDLRALIRTVPDFPVQGILFRDITPLLANAAAMDEAIDRMCAPWTTRGVDVVAAVEARGFIFGSAIARQLKVGLVPIRKQGRLPWHILSVAYALEYRSDHLEVHEDAFRLGQKVLIVDDLVATGGTARAAAELIQQSGAQVLGVACLIQLCGLDAGQRLAGFGLRSVIEFDDH